METANIHKIIMIYDGNCPVCTRAARWFSKRVPPQKLELLPCQSTEIQQRFPTISPQACLRYIHVVTPDGSILVGVDALLVLLQRCRRWRWLGTALSCRLLMPLLKYGYQWFAARRYRISAFLGLKCVSVGTHDELCQNVQDGEVNTGDAKK